MAYSIVHTESSIGWGGQEMRVLSEARGFIERGHRVTVLAPPNAQLVGRAVDYGVPIKTVPIFGRNLRAFLCLRAALVALHPDVINTHSSTDSWLVALVLLTLWRRPKVVRTRHICAQPSRSLTTRWLYQNAAQRVVTTGEAIRRQIVSIGVPADQVFSIPTGINPDKFVPGSADGAKSLLGLEGLTVIGLVATIRSWKGHRVLIDAVRDFSADNVRVVFVGDGPIRQTLEKEICDAGLASLFIFAGHQQNVLPWLQAMDIFVLPSYANEGISQALVQAMMASIPVVTTTAGAIPEVARNRETAFVVQPNDPIQLRAAIVELMANPSLASELAMRAREFVLTHHSEAGMLSEMDQLFTTVLQS
ncbi:glycosyltransferase family 4 protein [Cyanobium sp. HWJ4-Hawea]|uniref:glycosyltransferase family 4 protein n=1 Tax=Cyanobium sp. HWJ4-Hawea TaxID=2823713 RepID=UPI0020CF82D0|nr:glycosyltransferase family 4 protein [Cyanobium sp. HWJ4-Hawea]MCP9809870.1 glycosyltransferase family 4 protein [Cyanobium sp. HWJ4-Hawea]